MTQPCDPFVVADETPESIRRYTSLGANQVQVRFIASSAVDYAEQLERFGTEVWPLVTG